MLIIAIWIEIKAGLFSLLVQNISIIIFLSNLSENAINVWNNDIP